MDTVDVVTSNVASDPALARSRDRRYVWHTWTPLEADRSELMLSYGRGYRVWDVDGREYIDASGLNAVCGYGHPDVFGAISNQLSRLHHVDISVASHELLGLLAERIASYLPERLSRTLFVNSGSEGFDAAILIAAAYSSYLGAERTRIVTFARGYHGSTVMSRTLSGLPPTGHWLRDPVPVTHVELPVGSSALRRPESLPLLTAAFEHAINVGEPPLAVVVEPFLNVGGGIVLPPGFLQSVRKLCDLAGALLIVDEVFTGYGRTGRMFACQREDVVPDILVSSKGLGGGYAAIGAVTVQQRIYETFGKDPVIGGLRYGHTTSGHPAACAAALATLDIIDAEQLAERAERLGGILLGRLAAHVGVADVVDVRGLGLVLVLETASAQAAGRLNASLAAHGVLFRQQGQVLMAVPPLIIDEEGITAMADRFDRAAATLG
ncbi:MAG: aspartate aminotransferase family protein [Streptosporangiaceae bacterium]|nr:aspartate aminotransferase family protein [Streptosporangiaceae bacterium]